jgi:hypothetical protein
MANRGPRAVLLSALLAAAGTAAVANERSDWFKSLKIPGNQASCCDIADCQPTDADWRNGQWWVRLDGRWRPVPHSKVLTTPVSIDGAAYVCIGPATWSFGGTPPTEAPIYCFVPPNWPT